VLWTSSTIGQEVREQWKKVHNRSLTICTFT